MNFNFSRKPDYQLHTSMIEELIRLYGVNLKLLIVERVNLDDTIFGDWTHLKSNADDIFDIMALPETSESFDIQNYQFSEFGFNLFENCSLFVAKSEFDKCNLELKKIIGNLVVFPNGKVHEITDVDWQTPGINNLFTYEDQKSVYKISTKPYEFKLNSEISNEHLKTEYDPEVTQFTKDLDTIFSDELPKDFEKTEHQDNFDKLDNYFNELIDIKNDQKTEVEILDTTKSAVDSKDKFVPIKERQPNKPIKVNKEKNTWNDF